MHTLSLVGLLVISIPINPQRITTIRATFNIGKNHSQEVFTTTFKPPELGSCSSAKPCAPGVVLPLWEPQVELCMSD